MKKIKRLIAGIVSAALAVSFAAAPYNLLHFDITADAEELIAPLPAVREASVPFDNANAAMPAVAERDLFELCGVQTAEPVKLTPEEALKVEQNVREYYKANGSGDESENALGGHRQIPSYTLAKYNFSTDFYYNRLTSAEKKFYSNMLAEVKKFDNTTGDLAEDCAYTGPISFADCGLSYEEAAKVYRVLFISNPQYFYMGVYNYSDTSLYLTVDSAFCSGEKRELYRSKIDKLTEEWMPEILACPTEREKELMICRKLINHIRYEDVGFHQTIAGALADGVCVCNGYALAFSYLGNAAGLSCFYASGTPGHAWDYVRIDGRWYIVDTTWMDSPTDDICWGWCNVSYATATREGAHIPAINELPASIKFPDCPENDPEVGFSVSAAHSYLTMKWTPAVRADAYYLYRLTGDESDELIAITDDTGYAMYELPSDTEYEFRLLTLIDGYLYYFYNDVKTKTLKYIDLTVTGGACSASLSWSKTPGAEQYDIYRLADGDPYFVRIDTVSGSTASYFDTDLAPNTKYFYMVIGRSSSGKSIANSDQLPANVSDISENPAVSGTIEAEGVAKPLVELKGADGVVHSASIVGGRFAADELPDGTYTIIVKGSKCCPREYTVTVKDGRAESSVAVKLRLYGDIDGDGSISIRDALQIVNYRNSKDSDFGRASGDDAQYLLKLADINGDGTVNITDALQIVNHRNSKVSAFDTLE